jgi:predicted outer membrane repeat protein
VLSNTAPDGAGIYVSEGRLTLTESQVLSNTASGNGGGIYNNDNTTLTLVDSTVEANRAVQGGGLYGYDSTLTLIDSTVGTNRAVQGGGLFFDDDNNNGYIASATFIRALVVSNTADQGGGIYNRSSLVITATDLLRNLATEGGGLYQALGQVTIENSRILENGGGSVGSGVAKENGTTTLRNSCIVGNAETAISRIARSEILATNNWWGDLSGPGGFAPGYGDSISIRVTFAPFLTSAILDCPEIARDRLRLPILFGPTARPIEE